MKHIVIFQQHDMTLNMYKIYESHVATMNLMDRKSFMEHSLGLRGLNIYLV
jgi:hypothetical protein